VTLPPLPDGRAQSAPSRIAQASALLADRFDLGPSGRSSQVSFDHRADADDIMLGQPVHENLQSHEAFSHNSHARLSEIETH
jgi:hypothetical protein